MRLTDFSTVELVELRRLSATLDQFCILPLHKRFSAAVRMELETEMARRVQPRPLPALADPM